MTETSLVLAEGGQHAIVSESGSSEMLTAAVEMGMAQHELTQIKVPAGGATTWEYEDADGAMAGKELDVVIAFVRTGQRRYYIHGLDDSDAEASAPDCYSEDGVHGLGFLAEHSEGDAPEKRECANCPMNEFGTGARGRGKACSEYAQLFAFLPGDFIPAQISVPPASLKALRQYRLKQMGRKRDVHQMVTRLTLETVPGPPKFSKIKFSAVRPLSEEEAKQSAEIKAILESGFPPKNVWDVTPRDAEVAQEEVEDPFDNE